MNRDFLTRGVGMRAVGVVDKPKTSIRKMSAPGLALAALVAAAPVQAKELLYLTDAVPGGLDVDGPTSSSASSQFGLATLLEPLVYYKRVKQENGIDTYDFSQFEGRLAESWDYDEKTLTWTFRLRRNVKSCEGNPFTADDVIYTFARALSTSGAGAISWFVASTGSIAGFTPAVFGNTPEAIEAKKLTDASVRKVDDYTIQIRQSVANKLLLVALTQNSLGIYSKAEMQARATPQDPWAHDYTNNVGAPSFGPYCLVRWQKEKEFVVRANPSYYRGPADIERVNVQRVAQSSQRMVLLRSGNAQLVDRLTPREFESLNGAKGVRVVSVPSNASLSLLLNWRKAPLENIKLREAIALAVPYDSIIKNVYFGKSKKFDGVIPSIYPNQYTPANPRNTDLNRARAELAAAGYPEGKGLEAVADSFKLSYPIEAESVLGPTATLIQSSLRQIGIPVVLNPIPLAQLLDRALVKRDLEMFLNDFSKAVGMDSAIAIQLYFITKEKGGVANYAGYSNAQFDELFLTKAKNETAEPARSDMLKQIQKIAYDQVAMVPISENDLQWAMSEKLGGVGFHPEHVLRLYDLKLAD